MRDLLSGIVYVIDTGAFIDYKHYYSRVRPFWNELLDGLIKKDLMKSPISVFNELQDRGEDDLLRFCRSHKPKLFLDVHRIDKCDALIAEQVDRYKNNVSISTKNWQTDFDVIALGRYLLSKSVSQPKLISDSSQNSSLIYVVSSEKPSGESTISAKIPDMCKDFGLRYIEPWHLAELEDFNI